MICFVFVVICFCFCRGFVLFLSCFLLPYFSVLPCSFNFLPRNPKNVGVFLEKVHRFSEKVHRFFENLHRFWKLPSNV